MKPILLVFILTLFFIPAFAQRDKSDKKTIDKPSSLSQQITDKQKKEFIELLKKLPTKGEFYTEVSEIKAAPYLPVLFALTEKDIEGLDIYRFAAISRGICNQKEYRDYAVSHFAEIRHADLKLFWAAMLFGETAPTAEIVRFLKESLKSEKRAKLLAEIVGSKFEDFKQRVIAHSANK